SLSTQWQIEDIQRAASAFIDQLRPNDRVMVMSFDEKVHILSQFTNDHYALKNAIARTKFGDGTSLYDAVNHVLEQELSQIKGRKAVVLFTDGVDTTSRNSSYDSTVQTVEEADALSYPIRFDTSRDMNAGGYGGGGGGGYPPVSRSGSWDDILGAILRSGGGGGGGWGGGGGRRRGGGRGRGNGTSV